MTRFKTSFLAVIASAAAFAPVAESLAQAQTKIAVVNVRRLLEESPQAKQALQTLQTEFAAREKQIVQSQTGLKQKDEKFQRDGATMTETDRRNAERELRDAQRDLQRMQQEFAEDYNLRRNEEIGKVQRTLLQEVQTYAKANNFDLVVGDGVLYASESIDITPQVLGALQKRTGAAPKPATPAPKKE